MANYKNYWGSILKQVQIGVITVLSILGLIISDWVYRDTQDKLFANLSFNATLLDQYYDQYFENKGLSLASVGYRLLDINGSDKDSIRYIEAKKIRDHYFNLKEFGLADTVGYLSTFTAGTWGARNPNIYDVPSSARSFNLVLRSNKTVLGEVYYGTAIDDWMIPIRVPLFENNGAIRAVAVTAVGFKSLVRDLEGFDLERNLKVQFINNDFNTTQFYFPFDSIQHSKWLMQNAAIYRDTLFKRNKYKNVLFKAKSLIENNEMYAVSTFPHQLNHYLVVSVRESVFIRQFIGRVKYVVVIYLILLFTTIFLFRYLKKTEYSHTRALVKEKQYVSDIIQGSPSLIVGIKENGLCSFANPTTLNTIQYTENEIVGHNWWKKVYPGSFYSQVDALFKEVKEGGVTNYEMTLVRKDGEKRTISWNSLSFYNDVNEITEIVGFGHDVTDLKKAQLQLKEYTDNLEELVKNRTEQLTESNQSLIASNYKLKQQHKVLKETLESLELTQKQLYQSDKMATLGVLLAGVGHEINNPLNFIKGGLQGIKSLSASLEEFDTTAKPFYDIIEEGVKRATNIVKSLSHFSRKTGTMDENCDIHSIIDNCLTILHNKLKHKVEVEKKYVSEKVVIIGNEGKLHQAFLNVLANAEQAIEDNGSIFITTSLSNNQLHVSIRDTGKGIPAGDLPKVGDPFFTTKEVGEGTGLGLSITYSIIEEHLGNVDLKSKIGEGTEFILIFPIDL